MLAGLMENNYDSMWTFENFFAYSSGIYDLTFINIMNLDKCQIIELPFNKTEKYLKYALGEYTPPPPHPLEFNNLLSDEHINN